MLPIAHFRDAAARNQNYRILDIALRVACVGTSTIVAPTIATSADGIGACAAIETASRETARLGTKNAPHQNKCMCIACRIGASAPIGERCARLVARAHFLE